MRSHSSAGCRRIEYRALESGMVGMVARFEGFLGRGCDLLTKKSMERQGEGLHGMHHNHKAVYTGLFQTFDFLRTLVF